MKTKYILAGLLTSLIWAIAVLLFLLFHKTSAHKKAATRAGVQTTATQPAPQANQPQQPVQEAQEPQAGEETDEIPPAPLPREQILQDEKAELTPIFGEEEAATLAKIDANRLMHFTTATVGRQFLERKHRKLKLTDEAAGKKAIADDFEKLQAVLKKYDAIYQETNQKEEAYTKYLTKQWKRTLPLNEENLTFLGPRGEAIAQQNEIACPPTLEGYQIKDLTCREYVYQGGGKSIFYLRHNFLCGRDDFGADGNVQARRLFFPVPSYTFRDRPEETLAARGLVYVEELYDGQHTLSQTVNFYEKDGTVHEKVSRDFQKNREQQSVYDIDWHHRLISYHTIDTADGTVAHHHTSVSVRIEQANRKPRSKEGPYERAVFHNAKRTLSNGTWKANEDNTLVLDSGETFAPADQLPRAKTYGELYPDGSKTADAQA